MLVHKRNLLSAEGLEAFDPLLWCDLDSKTQDGWVAAAKAVCVEMAKAVKASDDVAALGCTMASIKVAREIGEYAELVNAAVTAYEAFVAAQDAYALRDEEWATGKLHACGVLVAAEKAIDKARAEVVAAVAALAGRKG